MEYFNSNTSAYQKALKRNSVIRYLIKIELLSANESTIGEITKDLTYDTQGQININYNQLVRRSCSITVANIDNKYLPSPNNPIWYNRKFKLWIGVLDDKGDTYWWSQGVFYTRSATANAHTVSIEAVDKGGALDGTLKTNLADVQYVIEAGTTISDAVKETLSLNIGANVKMNNSDSYAGISMPIDPVKPLIDLSYNSKVLKADISVDTNGYIGELLTSLADSYGADVYYDTEGRLRFTGIADIFFIDGYRCMAHQWDFINLSAGFANPNYEYSFDGINAVTVYTNLSSDAQALANAQRESKTNVRLTDEQIELVNDYKEIQKEVVDNNINLNETVFGNIDTNDRQILEWTQENLTRFDYAIRSWGETPENLAGSISTVFGMWDTFDDVDIAFSPILQTQSGAFLLDADTVWDYINGLISEAGEGWTSEELLALDVDGLVINGISIKKLIAAIGDTAERVSMIMHYVGEDGAYNLALREVQYIAYSYGVTVDEVLIASEIIETEERVQNISYTAYNVNPRSPLRVGAIGLRQMSSQEIEYIDTTQSDMETRCQQYAVSLLQKESLKGMSLSFECPLIPHLDVNKTIGITDEYQNINAETFIIQSITIPLGANSMKISSTNVNWMPVDSNIEGMGAR